MDSLVFFKARGYDFISVRKRFYDLLDLLVILKIFDGKISCRITASDIDITLYQSLDTIYRRFKLRAVIDMDMSGNMRVRILINLNDRIEKSRYTVPISADGRYDRHS